MAIAGSSSTLRRGRRPLAAAVLAAQGLQDLYWKTGTRSEDRVDRVHRWLRPCRIAFWRRLNPFVQFRPEHWQADPGMACGIIYLEAAMLFTGATAEPGFQMEQ